MQPDPKTTSPTNNPRAGQRGRHRLVEDHAVEKIVPGVGILLILAAVAIVLVVAP